MSKTRMGGFDEVTDGSGMQYGVVFDGERPNISMSIISTGVQGRRGPFRGFSERPQVV